MPGAMVRWRQLRRRGAFLHPEQDLPQWESQILDSLSSLATVSAERWVLAGPVSGSSGQAIMAAMGGMQPGWLLRVAPASLTCDVQLPDLGAEGIGRMIAVQHSGGSRSALRLGFAGSYVAACTSPGQVAQCVWDGRKWWALTGGVEWVDVLPTGPVPPNSSAAPLTAQRIGNWSESFYTFPRATLTYTWAGMAIPNGWIGTDVRPNVLVLPLVSQTANVLLEIYYEFMGVGAAPALANFGPNAPTNDTKSATVAVTTANYGRPVRVGFSDMATPIGSMTTLDGYLFISLLRRGDLAGDTYTTQYAGNDANVSLLQIATRMQVCSQGATITG